MSTNKNLSFLFLLLISTLSMAQTTPDLGEKHKVVIQFVSADSLSQAGLITNIKNLIEVWPKAQVEVVFHSASINMVTKAQSKFAKEMEEYVLKDKVKMVVCENTMKKRKVTKEQLLPFLSTVPVGIGEIIMKQEQGWSYLKGGL
jgi:uncharacterized protein